MTDNHEKISEKTPGDAADRAAVQGVPPAPEANQLPGFKVVDEAPSRGGRKLVWTAIIVIIAVAAGYYFGDFR